MSAWDDYMNGLANTKTTGYTGSLFTGYTGDESGKGAESTYGKNTFNDPTDKGELKNMFIAIGEGNAFADGGRIKGVDGPELHKDKDGYFTNMKDAVHGGSITVRLKADATGKLSIDGDPTKAITYESGHGGWLDNNLGVSGNDIAKAAAIAAAVYTGGAALGAWGGTAAAGTASEIAAANAAMMAGTATPAQLAMLTAAETSTAIGAGTSLTASTAGAWVADLTGSAKLGSFVDGASSFFKSGLGETVLKGIGGYAAMVGAENLADKKADTDLTITDKNNEAAQKRTDSVNDTTIKKTELDNKTTLDNTTLQGKNAIDLETLKDTNTQAANKRYSDSIINMTPIAYKEPGTLKRVDGTEVFNPDGTLKSPNKGIINGALGGGI